MGLKIIQWNCRSIMNKQVWLRFPPFSLADVLVFQETFLAADRFLIVPGYVLYRQDRIGRPGGGLLIAVQSSWSSYQLNLSTLNTVNEIMAVRIFVGNSSLNIVNIYSSSGVVVEDLMKVCRLLHGPSLILGDLNLHHPLWGASASSRNSEMFVDWMVNSSFCLMNSSVPTHVAPSGTSSLIDLTLCSSELLARSSITVEDDLFESDHLPISVLVDISPPSQPGSVHFRWDRICHEVNAILSPRADFDYATFLALVQQIMNKHKTFRVHRSKGVPAWWSPRCDTLLKQKKFHLRKARQLVSVDHWIKFKRFSAKLRTVIKDSKRHFWDLVCQEARDPRILFRVFRKFHNRSCSPPDSHFCLSANDSILSDATAQAESLADHFSEEAVHVPLPIDYGGPGNEVLNRPFEMSELVQAITRTKSSTPGEDKIGAVFYKGLNEHSRRCLLQVYNKIWSSGDIPPDWKSAVILPILKPGKKRKEVTSYRPIALTSVTCKICERMIANRISTYLIDNNILHHRHLGFQPFRDSHSTISMLHHDITQARIGKKYILGISLDLQAAYDSVYIDGLIFKCAYIGITGPVLRWIHGFLSARRIKVSWRGLYSQSRVMGKGVPQGAVLSPILFTIFMHDFFEVLDGLGIQYLIYADDIFLYCSNALLDRCRIQLQEALRLIARWCDYWKLSIRADKCHAINLSRRHGECGFDFSISSGLIEWTDEIKFLGFYITRRGGFSKHINYLRRKACNRINILKAVAHTKFGARSYHLLILANSTIRSTLEYGAAVLNTAKGTTFKRLEVLQTSAIRIALGLPKWVPNIVLRKHANIPPLADRISSLAFGFWVNNCSLGNRSPLYLFHNGEVISIADNAPGVGNCIDEIEVTLDHLIPFQLPLPSNREAVCFKLSDLPFQSTDLDESIIAPLFRDFIQEFSGTWNIIATDASKSQDLTTIAGCTECAQFGYRVHAVNSIFTAEALAIGTALDELIILDVPVVILSDSLSVLTALQSVSIKSPRVILWLHNKIQRCASFSPRIWFYWVPGHRGIPLNEKADGIAKGVKGTDIQLNWISPEDLILHKRQSSHRVFESQYRSSKYFMSHGDIPSIKQTFSWAATRRDDVLITRLLCRMLVTPAILFRFGLVEDGTCSTCHVSDSLDHILLSCAKYDTLRSSCWDSNVLNGESFRSFIKFSLSFCVSKEFRLASLRFLRNTGLF